MVNVLPACCLGVSRVLMIIIVPHRYLQHGIRVVTLYRILDNQYEVIMLVVGDDSLWRKWPITVICVTMCLAIATVSTSSPWSGLLV